MHIKVEGAPIGSFDWQLPEKESAGLEKMELETQEAVRTGLAGLVEGYLGIVMGTLHSSDPFVALTALTYKLEHMLEECRAEEAARTDIQNVN